MEKTGGNHSHPVLDVSGPAQLSHLGIEERHACHSVVPRTELVPPLLPNYRGLIKLGE